MAYKLLQPTPSCISAAEFLFLAKANINTSLGLLSKRPLKGPGQVFGEGNGTKYGLDTVSHVIECGSFTKPSYGGQRSSKYHG